eukprot:9327636-Karenia_brevis.AAC.1
MAWTVPQGSSHNQTQVWFAWDIKINHETVKYKNSILYKHLLERGLAIPQELAFAYKASIEIP